MRKLLAISALAVSASLLWVSPGIAQEAPTEVAVVYVIDGRNASEPFASMHDRYAKIYEKYGVEVERALWNTAFSGTGTGRQVLVNVFPDEMMFVKASQVVQSPEYQELAAEFTAKGFIIESMSLQYRVR